MHIKSLKNLQRLDKKILISIKYRRKIYIFSKHLNKTHLNHQEITYTHIKTCTSQMKLKKSYIYIYPIKSFNKYFHYFQ